ncbi:MAG: hypothetical protein IJ179_03120, partial [Oscillospiraceae bacterium]|nr:hypothetical protein [Oscillospiraceae bacterium]
EDAALLVIPWCSIHEPMFAYFVSMKGFAILTSGWRLLQPELNFAIQLRKSLKPSQITMG